MSLAIIISKYECFVGGVPLDGTFSLSKKGYYNTVRGQYDLGPCDGVCSSAASSDAVRAELRWIVDEMVCEREDLMEGWRFLFRKRTNRSFSVHQEHGRIDGCDGVLEHVDQQLGGDEHHDASGGGHHR